MITAENFRERATPNPTEQHLTLVVFVTFVLFAVFVYQFHTLIAPKLGVIFLLLPGSHLLILVHESIHAALSIIDGDSIIYVNIERPTRLFHGGGSTETIIKRSYFKGFTFSMGYLGSSAFFSLLIFSGFDILASKIMSFVLVPPLLLTLLWTDPRQGTTGYWIVAAVVVTTVPWWFVDHARGLRFWILWLGTSGMLYDLQLTWQTLVAATTEAGDAKLFAMVVGGKPKVWSRIWWFFDILFLAAAVFSAILLFKDTRAEQIRRAASFLPT